MVRIKIISAIRLVLIALLIHSLLPSLGSAQIPTWTSIGPEGGWVRAFVQDPSNSQVMYLIGDGGRRWVYKSTDKGQTWTNISMIWESIYTLAIDPKNPSILYAGGINDVHKSVDGGFTWTTQDFNKRDSYVNDVIVDPNDSDIIHTCGYYWNGSKSIPFYYRSTDAGVTWSCHHPVQDQHYANAVAVDPNNSDVIYLGCRGAHGKVYKSTNGGQDWTDISSIINREIHDIEIDPTNSNNVIAASYSSIYRSTNRGDTWMKNNGNAYGYKLAFDPYNPNIIYAAYYNLCFRSTDGGISWNNISSGLYGYNCYSLIVDWESPENIFIATRAGVFRSHNSGGSWTHSNSGLLLARIDALKLAPSSPTTMYIAFADNAVYKTTNAIGKTGSQLSFEWTRLPEFLSCGDITSFAIAPDNPDVLYALEGYGWGNSELFKSTTGGSAWDQINNDLESGGALAWGSIYQAGCWNHDGNYSTPQMMALSKSTNDGGSWSLSTVNDIEGMVNSIAVDPTDPNTVYAGGEKSSNYRGCVFKSIDGGSSWTEIGASIFNDTYDVYEVCIDPYNASKIYVCTNEGVYISEDEGVNWQSPSASLNTKCIVANPTVPNHLYIGTSSGVYYSINGGSSWQEMNEGLLFEDVYCIDFDPIHQILYAGTYGKGVFRYQLDTGVDDSDHHIPTSFKLHQNTPNPFNPKTTIFYELPIACRVHIAVYNLMGQEVSMLVEERKEAGTHSAVWDGRDAPSGVYICRMRAGEFTRSIKLLLNR